MCEKMLLLPGATGGDVTKRDGHDVEAAATMTLEEFERWFIREICRYHQEAADSKDPYTEYPDAFSAYGALVKGAAVCEGYARAMQLAGSVGRGPHESRRR